MAEASKQHTRRWLRFRLRTLLIIVTVSSLLLGWIVREMDLRRKEKDVVAWVEKMGGIASIRHGQSSKVDKRSWWEKQTDKWFGERVHYVDIRRTQLSDLSPLTRLKKLEVLSLLDTPVTDISPLTEMKNLYCVFLCGHQLSDLKPLIEVENLTLLNLYRTQIADFQQLKGLKNIKSLELTDTGLSKEQVQELRQALPNCEIQFGSTD